LARRFRDLVGKVNQTLAQNADTTIMMHAGIAIITKGEKDAAVK
jgi:adenosyl cobinamide kinase/adenosyl cobinamide phosphate guanylyltransferase